MEDAGDREWVRNGVVWIASTVAEGIGTGEDLDAEAWLYSYHNIPVLLMGYYMDDAVS